MLNEMENNKKFFKVGNKVTFRSNYDGLEYDLEKGCVYSMEVDKYSDETWLQKRDSLKLPSIIYSTAQDGKFVEKVLKAYRFNESGTMGVMLSGLKGSGKTMLAKIIANASNLPIITIDNYIHPSYLNKALKKLNNCEICILFDEVDKAGKNYDDDYLLKVLDGIDTVGKKMIIFTANEESEINEYMKDRCSRVRYWKKFKEVPVSLITSVLEDKLNDKSKVKPLVDFIRNTFQCVSFDNIICFTDEVNANPNDSFEELFADMNLSQK